MQKSFHRPQKSWTVHEVLQVCRARFPQASGVLRSVIAHAVQKPFEWSFVHSNTCLDRPLVLNIISWARKVHRGMPVARLLGYKEFFSKKFFINSDTLEPRPETEYVVEAALEALDKRGGSIVLDLGAGSGCIAIIVLLNTKKNLKAILLDKVSGALDCAQKNAYLHGVFERCKFVCCDMDQYTPQEPVDIICSNPPYIDTDVMPHLMDNVKNYDPACALDGGRRGLVFYACIFKNYKRFLKQNGTLIFEIGVNQKADIHSLAEENGWILSDVKKDLQGIERVLMFQKK